MHHTNWVPSSIDKTCVTMLYSSSIVSLLALATSARAAPSGSIEKRAPTVYLAGDSTMATAKGGAGTLQGRSCHRAICLVFT